MLITAQIDLKLAMLKRLRSRSVDDRYNLIDDTNLLMRPIVSIVIPTWNGRSILEQFLPSAIDAANLYIEQTGASVEILIVDDASTDDTLNWLTIEKKFIQIDPTDSQLTQSPTSPQLILRVLVNERNLGFGETCNRGVAAATAPLVFLLNNDIKVDIDAISPLVENFSDSMLFAAHCRVFNLESKQECGTGKLGSFSRGFIRVHIGYVPIEDQREEDLYIKQPLYSIFAEGGATMINRQIFLNIGGFNSLFAPFYWEDVELSYRAWKRGYSIVYEPRSIVHHRISSTIRKISRGHVRRTKERNRLIFNWISLSDNWLLTSNIVWLIFILITSPLRLRPGFILSFIAAIQKLPLIIEQRRENIRETKRTDKELFQLFEEMKTHKGIRLKTKR
jgi:GT2 family glycosyltransferase